MAPEQMAGKAGVITPAVDVYGLGAILYEALTGRPPFLAETPVATLQQVQQEDPVPPRRLQPTVPRDLETICHKCLRKEAGRRYATAAELADDLRRFRAGEPIRARPVGTAERLVGWCRRKPVVAGLLAALLLVLLAGSSGVLWQWQRARHHAAAFKQERDTAQRQRERAERHLRRVRGRVDQLTRLGRDLWQRPGLYHTGKAVLEEALAFYQEILPEEGGDPAVRRQAAEMYGQVAAIHHALGPWRKAVEAYGQQASLLASLLEEEPGSKALRQQLADSQRYRGNALRDLGEVRQARKAYDQAARLHEQLLRELPDASHRMALANTLLNKATLLSPTDETEELQRLYGRILALNRAAVAAAPGNLQYQAELALALEDQGAFFLALERTAQAERVLRKALAMRQKLLASGRMKGAIERYVARNHARLARALAAAGQTEKAEQSYREALKLQDPLVKGLPESPSHRTELAATLVGLADLLKDPSRQSEVEAIRRRAIRQYQLLAAHFRADPGNRRNLLQTSIRLGNVLWQVGRYAEAAEQYRQALKLDPESPSASNNLAWFLATGPEARSLDAGEAVRLAQKAVTARPKSGNYWNTLGVARYRTGDDKGAVAALQRAMRLRQGGDSLDGFFLALAHCRLGDHDQARKWFDRAVRWMDSHEPQNEELRRFRAEAKAVLAEAGKP
jgi:tetratricopeptide (TPR) repeat protein